MTTLNSLNSRSTGIERRNNPRLRELVDEMLASIRAAHNLDLWTNEERARCMGMSRQMKKEKQMEPMGNDATAALDREVEEAENLLELYNQYSNEFLVWGPDDEAR